MSIFNSVVGTGNTFSGVVIQNGQFLTPKRTKIVSVRIVGTTENGEEVDISNDFHGNTYRFEVEIPEGTTANLSCSAGNLTVNVAGDFRADFIRSSAGNVTVDCSGTAAINKVNTSAGNINISGNTTNILHTKTSAGRVKWRS